MEPPDNADLPEWALLYWDAWSALQFDRAYGAMGGMMPIAYSALSQYARDHGISGAAFAHLRTCVMAMDGVYLAHVAEKQKAATNVHT